MPCGRIKTRQIQKTGLITLLIVSLLIRHAYITATESSEHQLPIPASDYKWETYSYNTSHNVTYSNGYVCQFAKKWRYFLFLLGRIPWGEYQQPLTYLTDGIMVDAVDAIGKVVEIDCSLEPRRGIYMEITVTIAYLHTIGYHMITNQMLESIETI